jgi:hypothetical protein
MKKSIEQQIFTWKEWNDIECGHLHFTDVTLLVPVGDHPKGARFDAASVNMQDSTLTFYNNIGDVFSQYELVLSVGKKITPSTDLCFIP